MALLDKSWAYSIARKMTGSDKLNALFAAEYIAAEPGMKVLDVGCGPADILRFLPAGVEYIGLDQNPNYIETAKANHGKKGRFITGDLDQIDVLGLKDFDRIISMGVLHHLDDNLAEKILEFAKKHINATGYFVSYDPCFIPWQNPLARLLHKLDRGEHVRYVTEHKKIFDKVYGNTYELIVRHDTCYLPSTNAIVKAPLRI